MSSIRNGLALLLGCRRAQCVVGMTAVLTAASLAPASAQLVRYEFPGSVFSPTVTNGGVTASNINGTGSQASVDPGATLPNSVFLNVNPSGQSVADTAAAAVAGNRFLEFSLTAASGFALNLTSLTFDAANGGTSTPRGYVLRSSVDGFSSDISSALTTTVNPNLSSFDVTLGGPDFVGLTGTTSFRLYGFTPATGAGIFFDNIRVRGVTVVSAAPEPGSLALLLVGLMAARAAKRRRGEDSRSQTTE